MNIFRTLAFRAIAFSLALILCAFWFGCDVDSTSGVPSDNSGTIYNYAGLYMNSNNSSNNILPLVYPTNGPSGKPINALRLLQYGNVLEAYDSENQTWSGSISTIQSGTANFNLDGKTTAGQTVSIAGTLVYAEQKSTMDATWIEPNFFGTLNAQATVAPAATNTAPASVTIKPGSVNLVSASPSASFSVEGGKEPYNWSVSKPSLGTVSPETGITVTYTSTKASGVNIITVRDANNDTDTATATFP
jgi:hypothetical protein